MMERRVQRINVIDEFADLKDFWSPKVIARVNDQYVKVAKFKGELAWHNHANEDELFQVIKGEFVMQIEGAQDVLLGQGDIFVVPKGVMHNPVAKDECWVMLIETVTTRHTGDVETPWTKTVQEQLGI
jgi:quercetin dioxygenase-like cupin family protein